MRLWLALYKYILIDWLIDWSDDDMLKRDDSDQNEFETTKLHPSAAVAAGVVAAAANAFSICLSVLFFRTSLG